MLKAVLFDLDDTLYDHRHSSRTALEVLRQQFPAVLGTVPVDELEQVNLAILNEIHIEVLNGTIDADTARRRRFLQLFTQYGFTPSEEILAEITTYYREAYQQSWRAAEGAVELLRRLRELGLKIGIISNNLVEEQIKKLRVCGLTDLIDSLTISEEAGVSKPNPKIFHIALERLGCQIDEVVMIGDAWENDIVPARDLGIRAIWFNAYNLESPDPSVPSLNTFTNIEGALSLIF